MKGRLAWYDLRVIRDVISVLATQDWQKTLDEENCESDNEDTEKVDPLESTERLGVWFKILLGSAGVDINKARDEFYDMILYATQFISLATLDYQAVWWRLFHPPNSSRSPNPDPCIDLWWQAKTQRSDQKKRKNYKNQACQNIELETENSSDDNTFLLDDWDNWLILKNDLCIVRHTTHIVYYR